ncbi:MAG: agmatine deiminase family protein [bacterium]
MMNLSLIRSAFQAFASVAFLCLFFVSSPLCSQETSDGPTKLTHWLTPEEMTRLHEIGRSFVETDPPASPIRNVGEFDFQQGVLIRYPFGIPMALIKEMANDIMVTTIVNSTGQQNTVLNLYISNGVDTSNCNFLIAGTNSYWTRDYGPWFESDSANQIGIIDFPYNRPRPLDDEIPKEVAEMLGISWYGMNVIHTGGNYMTDGYDISASTTLVWEENPTQTHDQIAEKMHNYLGIEPYHVVPDPNGTYIDHIDCWAKFLAPDKILIRKVPPTHPRYTYIEQAAAYWAAQTCAYGYNYKVYRVNTPGDQPYTNSLILNDKALIPIMNNSWDDSALAVYQNAMPGYEVIGFLGSPGTPWESTDALHCRAIGIADVGLLYIKHYPLFGNQPAEENYLINAELIVCSGSPVISDSVLIHYRVNNGPWELLPMANTSASFYAGTIPKQPGGSTVQYYLTAADNSDRHANAPFIGEPDPFSFHTIYTNLTAIPDTLWFNTVQDCLDGKVTVLNNFTSGPVQVDFIETEGWGSGFYWWEEPQLATPFAMDPGDTVSLRVFIGIPVLSGGKGYFVDSLQVVTDKGTLRVVIMVDDQLPVGNPDLLAQNATQLGKGFPNPFTASVTIPFYLQNKSHVKVVVSDAAGKQVKELIKGTFSEGIHTITWDGTNQSGYSLPGGIYYYTLITEGKTQTRKVVLIR